MASISFQGRIELCLQYQSSVQNSRTTTNHGPHEQPGRDRHRGGCHYCRRYATLPSNVSPARRESSQQVLSGGTAACVVAGRLAEADPGLSILVIEGGQDNYNVPNIVNPLMAYQHLLPTSKTALFYKAKASNHLAGREPIVPSGGTLGGGSSINFMM